MIHWLIFISIYCWLSTNFLIYLSFSISGLDCWFNWIWKNSAHPLILIPGSNGVMNNTIFIRTRLFLVQHVGLTEVLVSSCSLSDRLHTYWRFWFRLIKIQILWMVKSSVGSILFQTIFWLHKVDEVWIWPKM